MTVFVIGGSPAGRPPSLLAPGASDRVIAADRGAATARAWGWPVHLLVGDLDSLPPADREIIVAAGTPVSTASPDKNETDMELAVTAAQAGGGRKMVICAALGGRTDHHLANILLLTRPGLAGLDVCIADGSETVRLLRGTDEATPSRMEIPGAAGDLLSLLPLGTDAVGVSTAGLRYPLADETLFLGQARGVSNVFVADRAAITLRCGLLLVIHTTSAESSQ